jgi:cell fate regulator YaaT (PSP1 superfamily)
LLTTAGPRIDAVGRGLVKKIWRSVLEELMGLRCRMERDENFLLSCRSRDFICSEISCVLDLSPEYGKDEHYHNLLTSLVSIVIHFEEYEEERKS